MKMKNLLKQKQDKTRQIAFGYEVELNDASDAILELIEDYTVKDASRDMIKRDGSLDSGAEYVSKKIQAFSGTGLTRALANIRENNFLKVFMRSGSTGENTGLHFHITDLDLYETLVTGENAGTASSEASDFIKYCMRFWFGLQRRNNSCLKWNYMDGYHYSVLNHIEHGHFEFRAFASVDSVHDLITKFTRMWGWLALIKNAWRLQWKHTTPLNFKALNTRAEYKFYKRSGRARNMTKLIDECAQFYIDKHFYNLEVMGLKALRDEFYGMRSNAFVCL